MDKIKVVESTNIADNNLVEASPTVLFGKQDKKIMFDGIEFANGFPYPLFMMTSTTRGYLKINALRGTPPTAYDIYIQFGDVDVNSDGTNKDISFPIAFPNECVTLMASYRGVNAVTQVKHSILSASQARFAIVGGSGAEKLDWFAIGY